MKISGFKMKKIEKVSIIRENIIPNVILSFLNLISKFINLFAMFFQNYTQRSGAWRGCEHRNRLFSFKDKISCEK